MANDRWLIKQISDYQNGNTRFVDTGNELVVYGDDRAHVWKITVMDGSEPAVLSGTATAYFVRADGSTVVVTGTIDGNVVSFQLADECYAVVGYMIGLAKISNSSGTVTIAEKHFRVQSGSTDRIVDPGNAFPSLERVASQYTDLYNAYQSLRAQLQTAISSVTVDSEVQGIRAWASSDMISDTAGEAVRGQVDQLYKANEARAETLPSGYRRLAWIRSTGTQYINTGVAQLNVTHMELTFASHNDIGTSNYGTVFGARHYSNSTQTDTLFLTTYTRNGKATLRYGTDTVVDYDTEMAVKKIQTAVFDRESATFSVNGNTVSLPAVTGWTRQHGIFLFALNHSGSLINQQGLITMYSCDIWENGVHARHFVPALRLASGSVTQLAGLYDTINDVFYPDNAGGDFDYYGGEADAVQERLQRVLDDEKKHRSDSVYVNFGWELGSLAVANGNERAATNRLRTRFIPCASGSTAISTDGDNTVCVYVYDVDKTYLPDRSLNSWGTTFTMPIDGYIRIITRKIGDPDVTDFDEWAAKATTHIIYPGWFEMAPDSNLALLESELHAFSEARSYEAGVTYKNCFTIGVISDMHNSPDSWRDFAATVNRFGSFVDLALCLGDTTQDTTVDNYASASDIVGDYIYTVGNHDVGYTTSGGITKAAVFNKFILPLIEGQKIVPLTIGDKTYPSAERPYYFKDFSAYKIRVYSLFEYEAADDVLPGDANNFHYHRYFASEQLQWFADSLMTMETDGEHDGYGVIVSLHQVVWRNPIINDDSAFTVARGYRQTEDFITGWGYLGTNTQGDCIGDIVDAWINRKDISGELAKTYSSTHNLPDVTVSIDYSSLATYDDDGNLIKGDFICYIGGHTHASYVVHLGDHPEQLQILVPSGNITSVAMRQADDIRPNGSANYHFIAINRKRKVVKLLKAGQRITGDCRERKIAEVPYGVVRVKPGVYGIYDNGTLDVHYREV